MAMFLTQSRFVASGIDLPDYSIYLMNAATAMGACTPDDKVFGVFTNILHILYKLFTIKKLQGS